MASESAEVHRGLAGVVADTTAISMVNEATNSLLYRGYPVQQLAARCSFEEVAYLINDSRSRVVVTSTAKAEVAAQLPAACSVGYTGSAQPLIVTVGRMRHSSCT